MIQWYCFARLSGLSGQDEHGSDPKCSCAVPFHGPIQPFDKKGRYLSTNRWLFCSALITSQPDSLAADIRKEPCDAALSSFHTGCIAWPWSAV